MNDVKVNPFMAGALEFEGKERWAQLFGIHIQLYKSGSSHAVLKAALVLSELTGRIKTKETSRGSGDISHARMEEKLDDHEIVVNKSSPRSSRTAIELVNTEGEVKFVVYTPTRDEAERWIAAIDATREVYHAMTDRQKDQPDEVVDLSIRNSLIETHGIPHAKLTDRCAEEGLRKPSGATVSVKVRETRVPNDNMHKATVHYVIAVTESNVDSIPVENSQCILRSDDDFSRFRSELRTEFPGKIIAPLISVKDVDKVVRKVWKSGDDSGERAGEKEGERERDPTEKPKAVREERNFLCICREMFLSTCSFDEEIVRSTAFTAFLSARRSVWNDHLQTPNSQSAAASSQPFERSVPPKLTRQESTQSRSTLLMDNSHRLPGKPQRFLPLYTGAPDGVCTATDFGGGERSNGVAGVPVWMRVLHGACVQMHTDYSAQREALETLIVQHRKLSAASETASNLLSDDLCTALNLLHPPSSPSPSLSLYTSTHSSLTTQSAQFDRIAAESLLVSLAMTAFLVSLSRSVLEETLPAISGAYWVYNEYARVVAEEQTKLKRMISASFDFDVEREMPPKALKLNDQLESDRLLLQTCGEKIADANRSCLRNTETIFIPLVKRLAAKVMDHRAATLESAYDQIVEK